MITFKMLRLLTFGGLDLESPEETPAPRLRPQRLAILAVLASAGDRGVSRERLTGLFWPDRDEVHARHSLRQVLYALRQDLQAEVIRSDAVLALDRDAVTSDVGDFRAAVAAGDRLRAAALARGPFLHGFYLTGAPEFERWVEEERAVLAADVTRIVLALAKETDAAGDHEGATEWWQRLTILDPLSGRFALGYLKALAAHGDRAGALAFARAHEGIVRRELEADADPDIRRLEAELRAMPSPVVVREAPSMQSEPREVPVGGASGAPGAPPLPQAALTSGEVPDETTPALPPDAAPLHAGWRLRPWRRPRWLSGAAAALVVIAVAGALMVNRWGGWFGLRARPTTPTFAVGMIREEGIPDTLRIGGVLTDMLATNLARVAGFTVLSNTRLFELMLPGQDTLATGYVEAARRAGATEILQGRLLAGPQWTLAMELQRVDLATGLVKGGYRVAASDRYALIDSMTAAIARDLRLASPTSSVADATTDSPIAYRLYEEGLRAFYQYDQPAARRLMQAALEEDSTFAMAAYYDALLVPDGIDESAARQRALRLAARAPERQRLEITADLLALNMEPAAIAVAESLATKYSNDPRAFQLLATALGFHGDWPEAVRAIERAIALDSASEPAERQDCRLCADYGQLANIYFWWDSLPAAERTAQRFLQSRPNSHVPWDILVRSAAVRGDTAATRSYLRRFREADPLVTPPMYFARYATLVEDYEQAEQEAQSFLDSPRPGEVDEGRWLRSIALRNQGRLDEAHRLARLRAGPADLIDGLVALEQGNAGAAVAIFGAAARADESGRPPGVQARYVAWNKTLFGMALAAAGDTLALRPLADTVEAWGQKSLYGRDRRAHHYLRGMLLVAQRRDAEAADELRQAIYSPANGFTRVNYELGKVLLRLDRAAEAVPIVRAALHGDIDGSNLYVTRTELHELLAQAFDQLDSDDSAAVHYRAVVKAWQHADPAFHARRDRARAWLARQAQATPPGSSASPAPRTPRAAAMNASARQALLVSR